MPEPDALRMDMEISSELFVISLYSTIRIIIINSNYYHFFKTKFISDF